MGYDMSVISPGGDAIAVKVAAEDQFHEAVKERDALPKGSPEADAAQKKVSALYEEMFEADRTYYRLNIWGMGTMRQLMFHADILSDDVAPEGEWPSAEYKDEDEEELTDESDDAIREFKSQRASEDGKVPAYKFGSNDGWIVTEDECQIIAVKLRKFANPISDEPVESELTGTVLPMEIGGEQKYIDMSAMLRVLKALGEGNVTTKMDEAMMQLMPQLVDAIGDSGEGEGSIEGPEQMPSVPGTPSEYPEVAKEQAIEAYNWMITCMSFARFNEYAASHGGYEVW